MRGHLLKSAATLCLVAIGAAAFLNFAGWITLDETKRVALVATIAWFLLATPWLGKADEDS